MYLAHFNGNHSRHNGQFINGDGDNDGIIDDHHNYSRNKQDLSSAPKQSQSYVDPRDVKAMGDVTLKLGGFVLSKTRTGKKINAVWGALLSNSDLAQAARDSGTIEYINKKKNMMYIGIANAFNRR